MKSGWGGGDIHIPTLVNFFSKESIIWWLVNQNVALGVKVILFHFQIVALLWFVVGYIPGGTTGMKYLAKMCTTLCRRTVTGGDGGGIRASLPI